MEGKEKSTKGIVFFRVIRMQRIIREILKILYEIMFPDIKISKSNLMRYIVREEMDKEPDNKGNRWSRGE